MVLILVGLCFGTYLLARFFVSPMLLALRRIAGLTRRLVGEWCGVPIAESYQPPPPNLAKLSLQRAPAVAARRRDDLA